MTGGWRPPTPEPNWYEDLPVKTADGLEEGNIYLFSGTAVASSHSIEMPFVTCNEGKLCFYCRQPSSIYYYDQISDSIKVSAYHAGLIGNIASQINWQDGTGGSVVGSLAKDMVSGKVFPVE